MRRRTAKHAAAAVAAAFLTLSLGSRASADDAAAERLRRSMGDAMASLGLEAPVLAAPVAAPTAVAFSTPSGPRGEVDFDFPDVTKDLEDPNSYKTRWVGRGRKKRKIPVFVETGVETANRLAEGSISEVVLHASLGQAFSPSDLAQRDASTASGRRVYDSCEASVKFLKQRAAAAHFIVCRDGRVLQMAEMKDVTKHVKDDDTNARSIGIETDTGYADPKHPFYPGDWDPNKRWRQSVSLAKLVRMIHKATDGRVALDDSHIKTHDEVDSVYCRSAGCSAHTDPGPYFKNAAGGGESVPAFGDPSQTTSPWGNLMRLVGDVTPPKQVFLSAANGGDQVRVDDAVGVAKILIWRLTVPRATIDPKKPFDAAHPVALKLSESPALRTDAMPPATMTMDLPTAPGEYQVEARDLVGNRSYLDFDVASPGAPAVAKETTMQPPIAVLASASGDDD